MTCTIYILAPILKVMIEVNTEKVEKILRENMVQMEANECELE